jgi:hypothetical protein
MAVQLIQVHYGIAAERTVAKIQKKFKKENPRNFRTAWTVGQAFSTNAFSHTHSSI